MGRNWKIYEVTNKVGVYSFINLNGDEELFGPGCFHATTREEDKHLYLIMEVNGHSFLSDLELRDLSLVIYQKATLSDKQWDADKQMFSRLSNGTNKF